MPEDDDPFVCTIAFPQRADGESIELPPEDRAVRGPKHFIKGENIMFMRPNRILRFDFDNKATLTFTAETSGFLNRTCQTHDSKMHQFIDTPKVKDSLHFQIKFWTDTIFRVMFADKFNLLDNHTDDPVFPTPESRMLIGRPEPTNVRLRSTEKQLELSTESIRLVIDRNKCNMIAFDIRSSKLIWQQRISDLFTSDIIPTSVSANEGRNACFESFTLHPQERIFGLGERFDSVPRRSRVTDFWNYDAIGVSNTRSYINVPFLLSTHGYGLFLNSSARTEWDIGVSEANSLGFAIEDKLMDYFVIIGSNPRDILNQYTSKLTGRAPLPAIWTFGLWLSRNSYTSWGTVRDIVSTAREHKISFDVIHLDTFWFRENWNPDLIFDPVRFANPEKEMADLMKEGIRVSLWQLPFLPPKSNNVLYNEGKRLGYFGKSKEGPESLFSYPPGTTGSWITDAVIDFSNPEAVTWYADKLKGLIQKGASAIKTDFGDCCPEDAVYEQISGTHFHNTFSLVYNAAVTKAIQSVNPESIVWARSGTAGSQRYPVHWGGDSQCSWSGLAGSLRGALSMGLSGFTYFSHDIGGFIGRPDEELYIRWAQFGLLSSHSRLHGAGDENAREPWSFGPTATEVFRKFNDLRYTLLPYIFSQAKESGSLGLPLVRAMLLEFPEDRNVWCLDDQYMFGDSMLVVPILEPQSDRTDRNVYLPKGDWFDFWNKKHRSSHGEWICIETVPLAEIPIFVKNGAVICYSERRPHTMNQIGKIERIEVYASGSTFAEASNRGKRLAAENGCFNVLNFTDTVT